VGHRATMVVSQIRSLMTPLPCRYPGYDSAWRNIVDHCGPCPHDCGQSDRYVRSYVGASSDERPGPNMHATAKRCPRGDVSETTDHAVVVDACVCVHDDTLFDYRSSVYDGAGHHE
jgi:hypothetical protein